MCAIYNNEKGIALVVGLMFLAILTLLGIAAVTITSTDVLISGSYKSTAQAFHNAEAGTEEARARLRLNAANPITDTGNSTQAQWRAYIGTTTEAQAKGFDSSNGLHFKFDRLQNNLDYTVVIRHQTDGGGVNVLYWGDPDGNGINARNILAGQNIYVITSYVATSAHKTVQIETVRVPPLTIPGALYVEAQTTILGSSTNILGMNGAGCTGPNVAGVATALDNTQVGSPPRDSVDQSGHPTMTGDPPIHYLSHNMDIQGMLNTLKGSADHTYTVTSATHTGTTTPGPGDGWGQPTPGATLQDPSSCSEHHIVHYNTGGTYVQFSGGVTGCGILLVEGDLDIHGGFSWYGPILVTGSVVFTGGGDKSITGAVLSGGSAIADTVGGNANIVYCSDAITDQTKNQPLLVLSWKDL